MPNTRYYHFDLESSFRFSFHIPWKNLNKKPVCDKRNEDVLEAMMQANVSSLGSDKNLGDSIRPESTKDEMLEADPGLESRVTTVQVVHRKNPHPQLKVMC